MPVAVTLTRAAGAQFDALPTPIKVRVRWVFVRLRAWPEVSGVKRLRGPLTRQYRIRTGDYRVQFRVFQGEVRIVKVGHRDGFYDE